MKINFVKLTDKWFADIINWNGSVTDLEMVNGADIFLEKISNGQRYISLEVSDEELTDAYHFSYFNFDGEGTEYVCEQNGDMIWLCPVTVSVFDKFPQNIWCKIIN